jgi:hypothetical protein
MLRFVWNTLWDTLALLTAPGIRHFVVVPSDTVLLNPRPRAILITDATAGDTIELEDERGVRVIYVVGPNMRLDFSPIRVWAAGTSIKGGAIIAWA